MGTPCAVGIHFTFPGVKRPGRGADNPPPSKCRGHETVGLNLYSPSGPQWPVNRENLYLYPALKDSHPVQSVSQSVQALVS